MVKILMVDIDGVLNSHSSRVAANNTRQGDYGTHRAWKPECVAQLKRVIEATGCQIVISSDWRRPENIKALEEAFEAFQLPKWIGVTPLFKDTYLPKTRGREIEQWLFHNSLGGMEIESYAIVDDNPWMLESQATHFVQTDDEIGLTESDASDLIFVLNGARS